MPASEKRTFWTHSALTAIPGLFHRFGKIGYNHESLLGEPGSAGWKIASLRQVHSDSVHILQDIPETALEGDGLITSRPGVVLTIRTADCLPVFLAAPKEHVIAALHCGWRGTALGLARKAVEALQRDFGTRASEIKAVLGPAIGVECYEVGDDVREAWEEASEASLFKPLNHRPGKYLFDLKTANRRQLQGAGVRDGAIHSVPACTKCGEGLLSYRRDPGTVHRLFNAIVWTE